MLFRSRVPTPGWSLVTDPRRPSTTSNSGLERPERHTHTDLPLSLLSEDSKGRGYFLNTPHLSTRVMVPPPAWQDAAPVILPVESYAITEQSKTYAPLAMSL